jgi:hypothetical protein
MTRGRRGSGRFRSGIAREAVAFARRNPASVAAWALAVGLAVMRVRRSRARRRNFDVPVINAGHARLYDPDARLRHTPHSAFDSRRDFATRA